MSASKETISSTRSVSLTILKAIERAFDMPTKNYTVDRCNNPLCIHFLGAEALELEQFMNQEVSSVSYAELFDGIKSMGVECLSLNFIGPNLSSKEITLNESRLIYSNLQIQIECHSSLYHEYYCKTIESGVFAVPDVLIMFNAGIWGYTSWLPTLDIFSILCTIRSVKRNFLEAEKELSHKNVITGNDSSAIGHNRTYDTDYNVVASSIENVLVTNDKDDDTNAIYNVSIGNDDISGSLDDNSSSSSRRNCINTFESPLFIVTSYTLEEAEDDEDTIRAHYSSGSENSSSASPVSESSSSSSTFVHDTLNLMQPYWFWEAEINPYSSSELIERETKICGRKYYANHAWQCFELRPSKA